MSVSVCNHFLNRMFSLLVGSLNHSHLLTGGDESTALEEITAQDLIAEGTRL